MMMTAVTRITLKGKDALDANLPEEFLAFVAGVGCALEVAMVAEARVFLPLMLSFLPVLVLVQCKWTCLLWMMVVACLVAFPAVLLMLPVPVLAPVGLVALSLEAAERGVSLVSGVVAVLLALLLALLLLLLPPPWLVSVMRMMVLVFLPRGGRLEAESRVGAEAGPTRRRPPPWW